MQDESDSINQSQAWYVLIIRASDERLYTGISTDVERCFAAHGDGQKGAKFFRGRQPLEVVYTETCADRASALRREAAIKRLSRTQKLELIGQVL